jgi:type IV pilus assembly protein PilP
MSERESYTSRHEGFCSSRTFRRLAALFVVGVLCSACSEEPVEAPAASGTPKPAAAKKAARGAAKAGDEKAAEKALPPRVEFPIDFSEGARSRDPFQSFASDFAEEAKKRVRSQREVILDQYSLDELKLTGIVTRITPARAMLVDPTGKGHVVHGGQFVGKAEVVQGGAGSADYEINWRVDRVRDNDVVLVREDPANPDVPSATRVIPLRPDDAVLTE